MARSASVHRFHDKVAAYLGDGSTTYMNEREARALARALNRCARDIESRPFVDSEFRTTDIAIEGTQP